MSDRQIDKQTNITKRSTSAG